MNNTSGIDMAEVERAAREARRVLFSMADSDGTWQGELSSSALATAVAVFALAQAGREQHQDLIRKGIEWLAKNVNSDGGWGDSPESPSNISTTLLCWSALTVADARPEEVERGAESWIAAKAGGLEPDRVVSSILAAYGNDRTFSAPILGLCALAGRLGTDGWRHVPQLPFEYSILPAGIFRFLKLDVVSYAVPALIAIGLLKHRKDPVNDRGRSAIREFSVRRALNVLKARQPSNGGFLEAVPLTAFVAMGLAASGYADHEVVVKCAGFIAESVREDGSWPIDTNLSTWVTTLALNALPDDALPRERRAGVCENLLSQQMKERHPFTGSPPGGWGWTGLPGAVPDADDTAGVLIALRAVGRPAGHVLDAARQGIEWLLGIQNRDGGLPTFCRGWGRLPFDRSCPDITAHALVALNRWYDCFERKFRNRMNNAMYAAVEYLESKQEEDGAWMPLWFGCQDLPDGGNPVYGTARTVLALRDISPGRLPYLDTMLLSGSGRLLRAQNDDGGWGGDRGARSTVEETALAVRALWGFEQADAAVASGTAWLLEATNGGSRFESAPIGLYFASLWYSEKLYPVIFTVQALERMLQPQLIID